MTDVIETYRTEMRDALWKCPNGRYAVQAGYQLAGFGQHRDSDPLQRANFDEARRLLCERAGQDPDDVPSFSPYGEDIYTEPVIYGSWKHWLIGWTEELLIRSDNDDLVAYALELTTHQVLNDDLYAMYDWDADHPDDGYCYSDAYDDCPCGKEHV
jgi:hypothetical protein